MTAWTLPLSTSRSMPFRISRPGMPARSPEFFSTLTPAPPCPPARLRDRGPCGAPDLANAVSWRHLDEHLAVAHRHVVDGNGLRRRQRLRPPRLQRERRPVLPALERLLL